MFSRWIIAAPPGHVVRLSWLSFNLEEGHSQGCDFDSVSVWDNSSIPNAGQINDVKSQYVHSGITMA